MYKKNLFSKKDGIILLVAALYIAYFAVQTWDYFMDDAYIGFTFARNLENGNGFVFYSGQNPVEGVTNIGWIFLLLIFSPILSFPVAAKVLGFIFIIFSVTIFYLINKIFIIQYQPFFLDLLLLISPTILLVSGFDFLYFSLSGMETSFLTAILLSMAFITIKQPVSGILPVLGGLAFLVRPEAIIVYFLFLLFSFFHKNNKIGQTIYNGLVFGSSILVITLGRYLYFGSVLPNTFTSKQSSPLLFFYNLYNTITLNNTNFPFPFSFLLIFIIPLLFIGAKQIAKRNYHFAIMNISILLTGIVFCIYAPMDWTKLGRYFLPYLPSLIFLFWIGILYVLTKTRFSKKQFVWRNSIVLGLVTTLAVMGGANQYLKLKPDFFLKYPGYVLGSSTLTEPSIWIRDHLPDDAIVASRRIGVLSYFSRKQVFDYTFGLTEPRVSHLIAKENRQFDSPNDAALALIWNDVKPDYILEDETVLLKIAVESKGSLDNFLVHGINYREINRFNIGNNTYWVLAEQR